MKRTTDLSDIPAEPAPLDYKATEDDIVLPGGRLCIGMIVLVTDIEVIRRDTDNLDNPALTKLERDQLREYAHWCRIERIEHTGTGASTLVQFNADYADGRRRLRLFNAHYTWFVKKSSISS